MDLILGSFAAAHIGAFTTQELAHYETILSQSDPDLYDWLTRKSEPPKDLAGNLALKKLLAHRLA